MPFSSTFHGRDIFAPVAAHLSRGLDVSQLGKAVSPEALVPLDYPQPIRSGSDELTGCVMSTDHFGNLITNIRRETLEDFVGGKGLEGILIQIGSLRIKGISPSYDAVSVGSPVAVIGSKNRLEISINQSDASAYRETQGDIITITLP
jgi:S-adenosylmethionine hydrolase